MLLVPLMVLGLGLETKRAVSTSLAVVLFVAMVGAAGYIATGFREELVSLPPLIVGSMLGAWPGVRLRELAPQRVIRYGFAIFMVLAAVVTLADALSKHHIRAQRLLGPYPHSLCVGLRPFLVFALFGERVGIRNIVSRPARTEDRRAEVRRRPGQRVRPFTGSKHGEERPLGTLAAPALARGNIEVVGEAATHEGAVALVSQRKPDVVLPLLERLGGTMGGLPNARMGSTEAFGGTNGAQTT